MTKHLRANLLLLGLTFLVCSVLYPLSVLAVGQGVFPTQASGSIETGPAGGSNLGANNPKLRERVEEALKGRAEATGVPADAVTASGSGLDPHITLRNAKGQLDRVVATWAAKAKLDPSQVRGTVEAVLSEAAFEPLAGLAGGEPLVNVLDVNLELVRRLTK